VEEVSSLLVPTADGTLIPLSQVATVEKSFGPIQINREKNQRRWVVQGNVRGRDLGGVIADIRSRIDEQVDLPPGYFVEYGGQFKNQQRAMSRLSIIVPIVVLAVFVMLYMTFSTIRHALIIMLNMPLALIGGIFGLMLLGEYLSVPAAVGFIALLGIAVQDSMVLVSCFNQLVKQGSTVAQAAYKGALMRLRPVLMTSVTTILGLLPLLLSTGAGAEVQRPLATVVIGGIISSTVLTLIVLPVLFQWANKSKQVSR
jgi:cobalt-zinc-cadmium resistance protein CzcA